MTDYPDRQHADELNRFWNAAATGEAPEGEFGLETEEMQFIRSLQRAGAGAAPESSPDLAWTRVRARIAPGPDPLAQLRVLTIPASAVAANGHASPPRPRSVAPSLRPWSRRFLSSLATAALLVLTVIGSLIASGMLRPGAGLRLPTLPGTSGALSVDNGIVTETLLDTPVKSLPDGHATVSYGLLQLQPGVTRNWPGIDGTIVVTVDRGTVEVRTGAETRRLEAGEYLVFETADGFTTRNVGPGEAQLSEVALLNAVAASFGPQDGQPFSNSLSGRMEWPIRVGTMLPGGAGRTLLERVMLPPGAALPSQISTGLDWVGIEQGRLGVKLKGDQLPFRWDPGEERIYGVSQQPPPARPGTEVIMRNAGDTPLILYRLAIAPMPPAAAESAAPATTTETLLNAPIAALPDGHATVQVGLHVLQPAVSGYWPAVGTRFFTADRGAVEIVAGGATHALNEGDQLTLETREGFTMRNVGEVEARVMEADVLDAAAVTTPLNATHFYSDPTGGRVDWVIVAAATLPDDAAYAKVERITVLPGVALEPFTATGLEWIGIEQGRLGVTLDGEQLPFRWDAGEERTFGAYQQLPLAPVGAQVTLRNAGDTPLVLYWLKIAA